LSAVAETEVRASFNWGGWYTVLVCVLLYLLASIDRQIINLLVVPIQEEFGVGDFQMGLLLGPAFTFCYALATFPLAWLADRVSRPRLICTCLMLWSVAACASGLATSYQELFVTRVLVGIGEAALLPSAYVLIAGRFPRSGLALPLSILTLGAVGGLSLAMGLGAWLLAAAEGVTFPILGQLEPWRAAFVLTGLPGVLFALLVLTLKDAPRAAEGSGTAGNESFWIFLKENRAIIIALLIGFGFLQIVSGALTGWLPTHLMRSFGWSASQTGGAIALTVLVTASTGKLLAGTVVDAMFRRGWHDAHFRYACFTGLIALPCILGAMFAPSGTIAMILVSVYFVGAYSNVGYGSAFVQILAPANMRGRLSGLYLLTLNLFAMIGPVTVGFLTDNVFGDKQMIGSSLAIVTGSALALSAIVLGRSLKMVRAKVSLRGE
jgi:MFS family permease